MSKAIITRYFGPTNTKPSRIKASAEGVKSKTYTYIDHNTAALAFCEFHGWKHRLAHGQLNADNWVHCFVPKSLAELLQHHVTGKIERGEAKPIVEIQTAQKTAQSKFYTMLHDNGFDALEMHTCRKEDHVRQLDSDEELLPGDFFTLYGHESGIGLVQIGDFTTFEEACEVAEKLGGVL